MFKMRNILGFCFTLAVLFAGTADTRAEIIIDTFDGPDQQAPPDNEIDIASAIGGKRYLVSEGETLGVVADGKWDTIESSPPGGAVSVTYRGDGTLGGIDLTDGGLNTLFEIDIVARNVDFQGESLALTVTDSSAVEGTFSVNWDELPISGNYFIPFSSLAGGADLTSVDMITVRNAIPGFTGEERFIGIDSIRAVPEPSTVVLLGLGITGFGFVRRRRATDQQTV